MFINDNEFSGDPTDPFSFSYKRATADNHITNDTLTQAVFKLDDDGYTLLSSETVTFTAVKTEFMCRLDQPNSKCVVGFACNDEMLGHTKDKFLMSVSKEDGVVIVQQSRPDLEHVVSLG